ncbi:MAG: hypothetical protein ACREXX_15855, partial [Gammaproteobacteria bacterium]
LSAYSVQEPAFFSLVRSEARRREFDNLRQKGVSAGEWQEIAEDLAESNDKLQRELADKEEVVRDLQAKVSGLEMAFRWRETAGSEQDLEVKPEVEAPPATIEEAVAKAEEEAGDAILFGSDVVDGIKGLAADAGPPDKVLNYLLQLGNV